MKSILKNFIFTFASNIISLIISAVVTFLVPKQLGIESYGYFQLYVFYIGYIGFLHFGWTDGIFLRYGGAYYDKLDKSKFSGQFWLYSGLEILFGSLLCIVGYNSAQSQEKAVVIALTGVAILLELPKTFVHYILQCTNRIKEYSTLIIIEKIIYIIIVLMAIWSGITRYVPIIMADLTGKAAALIYGGYQCRDIVTAKPQPLKDGLQEAWANISVGIKLMFANVASMLIIGVVRLSIENQWNVETFGKVSLTISISNMLMIAIRAISLVMFPLLRRTDENRFADIYTFLRMSLMIPLLGMLIFYYPSKIFLSAWLPQYAESLGYMALLFPMCVFESKMSMLISTYMKTLRKEKWILLVNVVTVICSFVLTGITAYWLHNLDLAVASIAVLLAFRCVFAELLLSKAMDIHVRQDIFLELLLTIIFIASSWFVGGLTGLVLYVIAYLSYLFVKRKDIVTLYQKLKKYVIKP